MVKAIKYFFISLVVVFLLLMIFFRDYGRSDKDILKSHNRGYRIALALEKYRNENKKYPEFLKELLPKYLPNIDPPVVRKGIWIYSIEKDSFFLGFVIKSEDKKSVIYALDKNLNWSLIAK